jgi:hypothetical protein
MQPFKIKNSYSQAITTTTSTPLELLSGNAIRIYNNGTEVVFIKFGGANVTATVTDTAIGPGAGEIFMRDGTHIAGITSSGTSTLSIQTGEGV